MASKRSWTFCFAIFGWRGFFGVLRRRSGGIGWDGGGVAGAFAGGLGALTGLAQFGDLLEGVFEPAAEVGVVAGEVAKRLSFAKQGMA